MTMKISTFTVVVNVYQTSINIHLCINSMCLTYIVRHLINIHKVGARTPASEPYAT